MKPALLAALCASLVTGCATPARHLASPAALTAPPSSWTVSVLDAQRAQPEWWRALGSPELDAMVAAALARNADLKVAEANLRAAQALTAEAKAALRPLGGVSVEGRRQRVAALSQPPTPGAPQRFDDQSMVEATGGLSWEIDLAGRLAAANRAAQADADEALWLRRQVAAATAASTVRAYAEHQAAQRQERLLDARIAQLRSVATRLEAAHREGGATRADHLAAQEALQALSAQAPELEVRKRNAARRLAVLTGRVPDPHLLGSAGEIVDPDTLPAGDPAGMLRRRPDVAAAEQRCLGALARAGIARADLYPRITLLGSGGLAAAPGDLDRNGAAGFAFGPRLTWDVFDFGRIRARVAAADARSDAALAQWEATVLRALEEADGALDAWAGSRRAAWAAGQAEAAALERLRLTQVRFEAGAVSALERDRAQHDWLGSRAQADQARAERLARWIDAHLALGSELEEAPARPSTGG